MATTHRPLWFRHRAMRWGFVVNRILIAAAVLISLASPAQSQTVKKEYKVQADAGSSWFESKGAACSSWIATAPKSQLVGDVARYTVSNPTVTKFEGSDTCGYSIYDTYYSTDLGVSLSTAQWFLERDSTSGGGDPGGGGPVGNACAASTGKTGTVNWTEGFTATKDEGDRKAVGGSYTPPPASGEMCQSGCLISAQVTGPGVEYFVSQQPTDQGLYRRSRDMPYVNLGTACTVAANAPNVPTTPEPKCAGALGTVNNVQTCVSTPAAPVPTTQMSDPSKTPIAGNPSAGIKPDTGEGSGSGSAGRTPEAGTGGNSGGSAVAAMGGKGGSAGGTATGTGTVKAPASGEQQAACGAPGQPICDVKINEGEMPKDATGFKDANEKLDDNVKALGDQIKSIQNEESKPSWSFSFQLPTGCSPYQVASFKGTSFTMDPCAYQSTIHDLMSMVWAAATAFCLIGMVGRTLRST